MSSSLEKFKTNVQKEKNIENIIYGHKINKDLLIAEEKEDHNMILFDFKTKKKILNITFHNNQITSIHICKKPLFIDNEEIILSENSLLFLTSSLDGKFALHKISYNYANSNYSDYKLIAQCKPTHDEINGIIQIENGQILLATRDQCLILFSNKLNNGNFEKLFEIKKDWPMQAGSPFEIRNNLIGVTWEYDDVEADDTDVVEEIYERNHLNDGIFIYLVDNNKIIKKKILDKKTLWVIGNYSYVITKDKLILRFTKEEEIRLYNLNNLEFMLKLNMGLFFKIYPFNEKYIIIFYKKSDHKAIIKIYNINKMNNVQIIKVLSEVNENNFFPISNDEYIFNNFIITIKEV